MRKGTLAGSMASRPGRVLGCAAVGAALAVTLGVTVPAQAR